MKKTLKIFMIALMAVMLLFVTVQPTVVLAAEGDADTSSVVPDDIKPISNSNSNLNQVAQTIITFIWTLSIIISVIVLMIIGVKYIVGGVQEKADYKKSLIPVVVGIVVVVSATTIVNFLFGAFSNK